MTESQEMIVRACRGLENFLLSKNEKYHNSIYKPLRLLARDAEVDLLIRARIDDKISRIAYGQPGDEDVILDLTGYLVLLLAFRGFGASEDDSDGTAP